MLLTLDGVLFGNPWQMAAGIVLAQAAMDRMLGYGLKHTDSFGNTH